MMTRKLLEVRDEEVHEGIKWNEVCYSLKLKKACD